MILTDVKSGTIDPTMLRRFYRRGRWDARKDHFGPSREFVIHAVALATSKICEDFVQQRDEHMVQLVEGRAKLEKLGTEIARIGPDLASVPSPDPDRGDGTGDATPGSLDQLAESRRAKERLAQQAQRDAREDEAAEVQRQVATVEDRIRLLPEKYEQAAASCREVGNLLWARYCMGYEKGKKRRVAPGDEEAGPPSELTFETPCSFLQEDPENLIKGGE